MTNRAKSVVLLSGGMDSCVCTAIARERHGPGNVALLHVGYGQRTQKRERRAFEEIAGFYGINERLNVQLDHFRVIGGSALTDRQIAVPENDLGASGPGGSEIPVTYVPFRNAHFLSVAVSWAEAIGAPLHLTWSCYQGEELACGACDSCLLRLRAFAEAGVPDPIPYPGLAKTKP